MIRFEHISNPALKGTMTKEQWNKIPVHFRSNYRIVETVKTPPEAAPKVEKVEKK